MRGEVVHLRCGADLMSITDARILLGLWPILLGAIVVGSLIGWLAD
jgi:hypothetical protein